MVHEPSIFIYRFLFSLAGSTSSSNYVAVKNGYAGVKQVVVQALKNGSPLVQQTMMDLNDVAQFEIHSVVYLAWRSDLQQGDSFKSGTYAGTSQKVDLTNPISQLPAKTVKVTVTNKSNKILTEVEYPED